MAIPSVAESMMASADREAAMSCLFVYLAESMGCVSTGGGVDVKWQMSGAI